jgi:hypothetical protein
MVLEAYEAGVGVVERFMDVGCDEMGTEGDMDMLPDVVKGVRSRISGKVIGKVFFAV